jgi:hypothetical protein
MPLHDGRRKQRWRWLLTGVAIGAVLMFLGLRVLQEMINEPPEPPASRR